MKTLDSVITRVLPNGEKQSVSSKCAEMDREVMATRFCRLVNFPLSCMLLV